MIDLVREHRREYSELSQKERLSCLDLSSCSLLHLQRTIRERLNRESAIPDEDIEHTVKQIITYPFLGGRKGSLKLQSDEKALIGETVYKEIKQQLKEHVEKELFRRKEHSEFEKHHYQRYVENNGSYEKIIPEQKHEVWAIDYMTFVLYGIYFRICAVYEVFSQAYLAVKASPVGTSEAAKEALTCAVEYSGAKPKKCLLSDNGKPFVCLDFDRLLCTLQITGQQIPPGQPWHNGALESGNRDLRKVLYTIAFQEACKDMEITMVGVPREKIFGHLETYCTKAQKVINEEIVRPKFKATPMAVLSDKVNEKEKQRTAYIHKKRQERKQRMELLRKQGGSSTRRIEEKVIKAWKKVSASMSNDELFVFSELVNQRYRAVMI